MAVNLLPDPQQPVVCFAPPGTPLYGESGPEVIWWRRGTWRSEEDFVARRSPTSIEEIRFADADEAIPGDFAGWVHRETASHLERALAFIGERPHLKPDELSSRARQLRDELESVDPGALDRFREEAELAAERRGLKARWIRERERELPGPASLSVPVLARFALQTALLVSLYMLYRAIRPDGPTAAIQVSLNGLSTGTAFDVVMWVYGNAHVFIAFAFLGWVFLRRYGAFDFVRNATLVAAAASIIPSLLLSSASAYGPDTSHGIPASAVPTIPALHLSIAIIAGFWGAVLSRSRLAKLMWAIYPLIALAVVIASKPQSPWSSVAAGFAAALIGFLLAKAAGRVHHRWSPPVIADIPLSGQHQSQKFDDPALELAPLERPPSL